MSKYIKNVVSAEKQPPAKKKAAGKKPAPKKKVKE
jgi:hypothetical protein